MDATPCEYDLRLVVSGRAAASGDVIVLELRDPTGAELPPWEPGAHIDLRFGPDLVRQYSLCSNPDQRDRWQIAVLLEPKSRGGSIAAHALREGDEIEVRGPRNNFELVAAARYLFIAGGIGITPIVPMAGHAERAGADWRLAYGGRTGSSMTFRDELARYAKRVRFFPQDETGLLDLDGLLGGLAPDTLVYCCGPTPMLDAIDQRCAGWPDGVVHMERFSPREVGEPVRSDSFEVELRRSNLLLTIPPDRSILDVISEAGIDVPSSCTEGTCGTCETVVIEGIPDHRDSLLTAAEQEASETMMICVSRAVSARLVLDI